MNVFTSPSTGLRTCETQWNGLEIYGHVEESGESCYVTVEGRLSQVFPMLMKSKIERKDQIRLVLNELFRELMGKAIARQRIHYEFITNEENLATTCDQVSLRVSEFCGKALAG